MILERVKEEVITYSPSGLNPVHFTFLFYLIIVSFVTAYILIKFFIKRKKIVMVSS